MMPISDGFKLNVLEAIRRIGESFDEPDDDWMPVFLIPGSAPLLFNFDSERSKNLYAKVVMPGLIKATGAKEFAFVSSVWASTGVAPPNASEMTAEEQMRYVEENFVPPSLDINRKEYVMASFGSSDGSQEMWMAEIERSDDGPPSLGEWTHSGEGMAGRFVDRVMEAVKKNG